MNHMTTPTRPQSAAIRSTAGPDRLTISSSSIATVIATIVATGRFHVLMRWPRSRRGSIGGRRGRRRAPRSRHGASPPSSDGPRSELPGRGRRGWRSPSARRSRGQDPQHEVGRRVGRVARHAGRDHGGLEPEPALDDRVARRAAPERRLLGLGIGCDCDRHFVEHVEIVRPWSPASRPAQPGPVPPRVTQRRARRRW